MIFYTTSQLYRSPSRFDSVNSLAWSPNDNRLVAGYEGGTIYIWNKATDKHILIYRGHSESVYTVVWSPDGKRIASASEDKTVQVWEAATGKTLLTYRGHSRAVLALGWSPDGRYIASGSDGDRGMQVWVARTGKCLWDNRDSTSSIDVVAWAPDGSLLAAGFENGEIKIWHTQTGKKLFTYEGHGIDESEDGLHGINDLAWSPDGTHIASVAEDETLQVWDATTGQISFTIPCTSSVIIWSPDGTRLAGRTHKDRSARVVVWDAKIGQQLFAHRYWSQPCVLTYSPDGTCLVVGYIDGKIRLLEEVHRPLHPLQRFWFRLRG